MAQKHQQGWLKKEVRSQGETWVLFYGAIRKSDGKRVENKVSIGLVRDFPDKNSARGEVERLHLHINQVDENANRTNNIDRCCIRPFLLSDGYALFS